jgi:hypothetical protein
VLPILKKTVIALAIGIAAIGVIMAVVLFFRMRGPHHNYELDRFLPEDVAAAEPGKLEVGVAKRDITPVMELYDPWIDVNENGKYDPGVDTYEDRNNNGKFDGIWIAGFGTNRPAKGINDPQWTRAIAMRNNGVTVVMVTIDAIGIYHNEFITIRKALDPALGIDHVMFSSTHCHEVVDTMKIWSFWKRIKGLDVPGFGFDRTHLDFILEQTVEAVEEAVSELAPCDMYCAQVKVGPEGFVSDTRKPIVMDENMYLMRFNRPGTADTIATVVNWGNHPETLGGSNSILSSDFAHYLREGIEDGVPDPNGMEGIGGMCLYFQGMVGGLMCPLRITVPHRDGQQEFKEASFEKTESLGYNTALVALKTLESDAAWKNENPLLAVDARTCKSPMEGHFKYAIMLGLIHEGYYWGGKAKTEINVIRIGDVLILTAPGELYPEVVEGGVEAKPGRDFMIPPAEVPPLRHVMREEARMAFVVGLANDEIGYMIPKSQWDVEAPFVYNGKDQYGEQNSGGPDVARIYHLHALDMLKKMNETF